MKILAIISIATHEQRSPAFAARRPGRRCMGRTWRRAPVRLPIAGSMGSLRQWARRRRRLY